jgi:hypothetical protein
MPKLVNFPQNRFLLVLICLLTTGLFSSCKKDDEESIIDFGPNGGVQFRTTVNQPMGGDDTDWSADGLWNKRERQLFASLNLPLDGPQQTGTWYCSVYPNPSLATAGFNFLTSLSRTKPAPAGARLVYVIVDRRYKELLRNDVDGQGITISFQPNTLPAGQLYRLYYVCYVPGQQVYYRSHGDIKVD